MQICLKPAEVSGRRSCGVFSDLDNARMSSHVHDMSRHISKLLESVEYGSMVPGTGVFGRPSTIPAPDQEGTDCQRRMHARKE